MTHVTGHTFIEVDEHRDLILDDLGAVRDGIFRGQRAVGPHFEDQAVIVGHLTHTSLLHSVGDLANRREGGVQLNQTDFIGQTFVHVGRHIALAHAHFKFHLQHHVLGEGGDVLFRIEHGHMLIGLNLGGRNRPFAVNAKRQALRFVRVHAQTHLLDVQHHVGHVFEDAVDGGELMLHAGNLHRHKGSTLQGGKQHTTHGIADGGAVTSLQRFANKLAVRAAGRVFVAQDLVGLDELVPVARIDKAFALFDKHEAPAYFE